jgi:DNA-binding NarL/FixJ family response regulator
MRRSTYSVLLVDDEPGFSEALRIALESEGFFCAFETDMSSGLKYLERHEVSVLVTDVMMSPGSDFPGIPSSETGFHFIRMVSRRWPMVRIVCLSVIGDQAKINLLLRQGVRYLRKGETPLDRAVLTIRSAATGLSSF